MWSPSEVATARFSAVLRTPTSPAASDRAWSGRHRAGPRRGEKVAAAPGQSVLPGVEECGQRVRPAGLAQRVDELRHLGQPIAAPAQLPGDLGVAYAVRSVFAITRCPLPNRAQDALLLP